MNTLEDLRIFLNRKFEEGAISRNALAKALGIQQGSISRFANGETGIAGEAVFKILNYFGGKVTFSDNDPTREVVFVNPRLHEDYKSLPHPIPDDYRAIPLTNLEVAAGPGLAIQEEALESWVLVYAPELANRRVRLVAVRVEKGQRSMLPLIMPGDIVVIDLDDRDTDREGIFLIRDPEDGLALKRVASFMKRGQRALTFYSDNTAEYKPNTYFLTEFKADPIIGRCIWQWGDLEKR